ARRSADKARPGMVRLARLALEPLEDRIVFDASVTHSGNVLSVIGTTADNLWLRTDDAQPEKVFYSHDGANYQDAGVTVSTDLTVTVGLLDHLHLGRVVGQGNAITIQGISAGTGASGQLASPNVVVVEGFVNTKGGNLSVQGVQSFEVADNVTI